MYLYFWHQILNSVCTVQDVLLNAYTVDENTPCILHKDTMKQGLNISCAGAQHTHWYETCTQFFLRRRSSGKITNIGKPYIYIYIYTPRGKESAEVQITQKIGKERGKSYRKMKTSPDERHTQTDGSLITNVFLNQKRINICEPSVKTAPCGTCRKLSPGGLQNKKGEE